MNNNIIISSIKGGFGNQLFQYAAGLAIAMKNKSKLKLDLSFFNNDKYKSEFKLNYLDIDYEIAEKDEILKLKNSEEKIKIIYRLLNKLGIRNKFNKKTHIIDGIGFKPSHTLLTTTSPAYIDGWCVKEIYFREIKETLKKRYVLKFPLTEPAQKVLQEIIKTNSVSLHIRRGDYVNNDIFTVLPLTYYKRSIIEITKKVDNPVFFIFSDDLDWCRQNLNIEEPFKIIDLKANRTYNGQNDLEDFFLMKSCKHNISANSSFSWWAAYLNSNTEAIVTSPAKWFEDDFYQSSLDNYSFIPKNWIKV